MLLLTKYIGSIPICYGIEQTNNSVCSGHGVCTTVNSCSCTGGLDTLWTGHMCQFPMCYGINSTNSAVVCSGHGICTSANNCSCHAGWVGHNCSVPVCFSLNATDSRTCSGHGNCSAPDTCQCLANQWTGLMCQFPICYGKNSTDTASVCSGNGTCISNNTCSCNACYAGNECSFNFCRNYTLLMVQNANYLAAGYTGVSYTVTFQIGVTIPQEISSLVKCFYGGTPSMATFDRYTINGTLFNCTLLSASVARRFITILFNGTTISGNSVIVDFLTNTPVSRNSTSKYIEHISKNMTVTLQLDQTNSVPFPSNVKCHQNDTNTYSNAVQVNDQSYSCVVVTTNQPKQVLVSLWYDVSPRVRLHSNAGVVAYFLSTGPLNFSTSSLHAGYTGATIQFNVVLHTSFQPQDLSSLYRCYYSGNNFVAAVPETTSFKCGFSQSSPGTYNTTLRIQSGDGTDLLLSENPVPILFMNQTSVTGHDPIATLTGVTASVTFSLSSSITYLDPRDAYVVCNVSSGGSIVLATVLNSNTVACNLSSSVKQNANIMIHAVTRWQSQSIALLGSSLSFHFWSMTILQMAYHFQ